MDILLLRQPLLALNPLIFPLQLDHLQVQLVKLLLQLLALAQLPSQLRYCLVLLQAVDHGYVSSVGGTQILFAV